MSKETEKKDIEIVAGDGTELELSPVFNHLNVAKPKPKEDESKKKKIIIPKIKE